MKNTSPKKSKISFKPFHGKPYKKYNIFRKKQHGIAKFIGNMIAPNDERALAKAKENFDGTVFVVERK